MSITIEMLVPALLMWSEGTDLDTISDLEIQMVKDQIADAILNCRTSSQAVQWLRIHYGWEPDPFLQGMLESVYQTPRTLN